jgi:hypothetical protein
MSLDMRICVRLLLGRFCVQFGVLIGVQLASLRVAFIVIGQRAQGLLLPGLFLGD